LVDTDTLTVTDTVPIPAFPQGYAGSSPTAVAFSPSGRWLYVACGGNNAVAVLEQVRRPITPRDPTSPRRETFRLRGHVPVDWYPVGLAVHSDVDGTETVFAANAKGIGSQHVGNGAGVRSQQIGTIVSFPGRNKSLASSMVSESNNPFAGAPPA